MFYCQAQSQLQLSWTELVFIITLPNKFADPQPVSHPGKSVSQHSVAGFEPNFSKLRPSSSSAKLVGLALF